jgi:hypothetical protein
MIDVDTFLTTLYVMVDDFCTLSLPSDPHPGLQAALSRSEVVTLALFGQWQSFGSARGFYRYAQRHLRAAFPQLPSREQYNRPVRRPHTALIAFVLLSLSRLNYWLPWGQAHPEVVQGTAEFHHQITDALLPQADPVFHNAAALDAAVDMLDP